LEEQQTNVFYNDLFCFVSSPSRVIKMISFDSGSKLDVIGILVKSKNDQFFIELQKNRNVSTQNTTF